MQKNEISGRHVRYGGSTASRPELFAALIAFRSKSTPEAVGDGVGFKVTTLHVNDLCADTSHEETSVDEPS